MNQITEVPEPPLPDLDDIISNVGQWEECFANLIKQKSKPFGSYIAHEAFESAYVALRQAQTALKMIEQESVE